MSGSTKLFGSNLGWSEGERSGQLSNAIPTLHSYMYVCSLVPRPHTKHTHTHTHTCTSLVPRPLSDFRMGPGNEASTCVCLKELEIIRTMTCNQTFLWNKEIQLQSSTTMI